MLSGYDKDDKKLSIEEIYENYQEYITSDDKFINFVENFCNDEKFDNLSIELFEKLNYNETEKYNIAKKLLKYKNETYQNFLIKLLSCIDIELLNSNNFLLFRMACFSNSLIAKFMYDNIPYIDIHCKNDYIFRKLCLKSSDIELLDWIFKIDDNINYSYKNYEYLTNICINGNIEILKWAVENIKSIKFEQDHFVLACCHKIEFAQFVYEIFNVDILYKESKAFKNAIKFGELKTAIWLVEKKAHQAADLNKLFYYCCSNNNLEKVIWMCNTFDINIGYYANKCAKNCIDKILRYLISEQPKFFTGKKINKIYLNHFLKLNINYVQFVPEELLPSKYRNLY